MPAKILIVDDEPDLELLIRQRFRRHIREQIYDFSFARNGAEALVLTAADPAIELVLSDVNMPVMDGLTLLGNLRRSQPLLGTVIVSAYGDMPNIRAAMNLGALDFLTKPIDFQDFEVTVTKTLRQIQELREAVSTRDRLLMMERDLQTAAEIQRSFLPQPAPAFAECADFKVHAAMLPARAVGGDFYDYFLIDRDRLGLVIGDVSGKGVPAALFMAVSRTLLRATAFRGVDPAECLAEVNKQLLRDCYSSLFVTIFYGVLHLGSGELCYSTGGHPPPYLLRASGELASIPAKGLLVGALDNAAYTSRTLRLSPGDSLFLYTDGITEARDDTCEMFLQGRLQEALRSADRAAPEDLVNAVLEAVRRFTGQAPQFDDMTALALRYRVAGTQSESTP